VDGLVALNRRIIPIEQYTVYLEVANLSSSSMRYMYTTLTQRVLRDDPCSLPITKTPRNACQDSIPLMYR